MNDEIKSFMKKENKLAIGIALGTAIGTAIGVATNNMGLWIGCWRSNRCWSRNFLNAGK